MKKTILLVHIGPVQDFIASARRCRDLWYGSRLLSEVSRRVADAMLTATGVDPREQALIFPGRLHARDGDADVSVANKIQLILDSDTREEAARIAEAGRARMREFLEETAREEFGRVSDALEAARKPAGDFKDERALNNVLDMMELFWIAVPFEAEQYATARKKAEALLGARKNTRDWAQAAPIEAGLLKSSLDGVRESVIHERVFDARVRDPYQDWQRYQVFGVRGSERLCGVGLLKRRGTPPGEERSELPSFHSTSHMASGPTRARIDRLRAEHEPVQVSLDQLIRVFEQHLDHGLGEQRTRIPRGFARYTAQDPRQGQLREHSFTHAIPLDLRQRVGLDGVVLYPNRVAATGSSSLLSQLELGSQERQAAEQTIHRAQRDLLRAIGSQEPFAYYALLLADGDKMGAAIDALGDEQLHRDLSTQLDEEFAARCHELVASHGGSLIYSGGDDVLALLPLHTALQCAETLNEAFDKAMARVFEGFEPPDELKDTFRVPTLSVGLAVAHAQEPFGQVRDLAKDAEMLAKGQGRARLAIIVQKRSNAAISVVGPWRPTDGSKPLPARLKLWGRVLSERGVPSALAYKLEDAVAPLLFEAPGTAHVVDDERLGLTCLALVQNVINRRDLRDGGISAALQEEIEQLYTWALAEVSQSVQTHPPAPLRAVQKMAHELRIASIFNDAWQEAFGDLENSRQVEAQGAEQ